MTELLVFQLCIYSMCIYIHYAAHICIVIMVINKTVSADAAAKL